MTNGPETSGAPHNGGYRRRMATDVQFRPPVVADGVALWRLAADTGVLDVNSAYAYVLWCRDFAATSTVAIAGDPSVELAGFVTGYRPPARPNVLFVWQIAVGDRHRNAHIARRMLIDLVQRARVHGVDHVEATVAPSNAASLGLFRSVARRLDAPCQHPCPGGFDATDLADGHEEEPVLRIGPF